MIENTYINKLSKSLFGKGVGKKSSFSREGEQRGTSAENRRSSEINGEDSSATFILLGPPGSGKSTEAKILHSRSGLQHIEIGSELRRVALENSPFGKLVNDIIYQKKELVPDGIVGEVLNVALSSVIGKVLLDGAPRCVTQIDEVEAILAKHGRKIKKLIYLTLPAERSVERISRRYLCSNCKQAYKLGKDPETESGLCSLCGGQVSQRYDDTPEGVIKRYQVFHEQTVPVIEHFRKRGLVLEVEAEGEPEAIAEYIMENLEK